MRECWVCKEADEDVVVLSTGFAIHPYCWQHMNQRGAHITRAAFHAP